MFYAVIGRSSEFAIVLSVTAVIAVDMGFLLMKLRSGKFGKFIPTVKIFPLTAVLESFRSAPEDGGKNARETLRHADQLNAAAYLGL